MYRCDYHTHSRLSPDSQAPLEAMAEAAVRSGLAELCVTDHYDLLGEDGVPAAPFDWAPALEQYAPAAERFSGRLALKLGLELGGAHLDRARCAAIAACPDADFIIGSLHNWSSERHDGTDYYFTTYDTPALCKELLDDYFTAMVALAPMTECYDVLGHIIYPLRYANRDGQYPSLQPYEEQIRFCLRTAVEGGRGIELNTCRGRTVAEWKPILELYRACGGEIITLGSDAHDPSAVAAGFREAEDLLRCCGFAYTASFHRRRPVFHKL